MKVLIRNLDFVYDIEGSVTFVNVRFDSAKNDSFSLNGLVKITSVEYSATTSMKGLEDLVLEKVKLQVNVTN